GGATSKRAAMRWLGVLMVWVAAPAMADGWARLDDAGIAALLTDARVEYSAAWQEFRASGRTLYDAGQPSWGYWRVENGAYCSQWPPSADWACYAVEADGAGGVRFIGAAGDISEGVIVE
ncbi:MAG: hypothetical protein AAF914_12185, partial [Pseudomonadota bacterium]